MVEAIVPMCGRPNRHFNKLFFPDPSERASRSRIPFLQRVHTAPPFGRVEGLLPAISGLGRSPTVVRTEEFRKMNRQDYEEFVEFSGNRPSSPTTPIDLFGHLWTWFHADISTARLTAEISTSAWRNQAAHNHPPRQSDSYFPAVDASMSQPRYRAPMSRPIASICGHIPCESDDRPFIDAATTCPGTA